MHTISQPAQAEMRMSAYNAKQKNGRVSRLSLALSLDVKSQAITGDGPPQFENTLKNNKD